MSQSYTNESGTFYIPGTYVTPHVVNNAFNAPTIGIVTIIGEADEGVGYQSESDLEKVYTPDQYAEIVAKYTSGRIVDAALALTSPASSPDITGSVAGIRIIQTNQSVAAQAAVARAFQSAAAYGSVAALKRGVKGSNIKFRIESTVAESAPTTGEFAYIPGTTTAFSVRANGQDKQSVTASATDSPDTVQQNIDNPSKNIMCLGGKQKNLSPTAQTITAVAVSASKLDVSLPVSQVFPNAPAAGDTVLIMAAGSFGATNNSVIAGAGLANVGSYLIEDIINTVSSAVMTLKRITAGTCINASGVSQGAAEDIQAYSPLEIKNVSGEDRGALVGIVGTYASTVNDGLNVVLNTPATTVWAAQPKAGDIIQITAAFAAIQDGFYQVVSSTTSQVSAYRLSKGTAGGSTGTTVVAVAPTLATQPIRILAPIKDGAGKTLSIEGSVEAIFKDKDTGANMGLSNKQFTSAAEQKQQITISRGTLSEAFSSGGEIILNVGSSLENATLEVLSDKIDAKINNVLSFSIPMSQFRTVKDVADYITSQSGWSAAVSSARLNGTSPADLDKGVYAASGLASHKNARIKRDAKQFERDSAASSLAKLSISSTKGLPENQVDQFLSGGAKGGTTSMNVVEAIDICEALETNFIVTLMDKDASADMVNLETESSSTYTISAINAYAKSHVLKMSTVKRRKNRSHIGAISASYLDCKEAAGEASQFRQSLAFQPVKRISAAGEIVEFGSWMGAVIAAGMSAAAGYKGIVKKQANVSSIGAVSGFNPSNPGDLEDALKSGLLIMERINTGGVRWVSDQTTYSQDNNFVFNSIQAVYLSDLITYSLIDKFDKLVVGQSVADISREVGLSVLDSLMFDLFRLKWIAQSDDAPKGYKDATVKIKGGAMEISVSVKLAGIIYFVPINLFIEQVEQA
jgi:hypothetical protein